MNFRNLPRTNISQNFDLLLKPAFSAELKGQTTFRKHIAWRVGLAISFMKQIQKYLKAGWG